MDLASRWDFFDGTETRPIPNDPDKPTDTEKLEGKHWDREDRIAQSLLSQRLPIDIAMDLADHPTAKKQWEALKAAFIAKSEYAKADMHQSFLDMRCPKGGDVREFLTGLKSKRRELRAAGVNVTEAEYERTILRGIPDGLANYASQMLNSTHISTKYTGKAVDMSDIIDSICEEADRMKIRRALKDQAQGQAKSKKGGQTDEALAATSTSEGGNRKHRKGKCNHCGKEGHWIRECRTKKREEATARNQSGQAAQASLSTSTSAKAENKPVGSANAIIIDESADPYELWMVDQLEEDVHVHADRAEQDLPRGEPAWNDNEEVDPHAKPVAAETYFNWAESDDWLDKEGEGCDIEEDEAMAGAVITPVEEDSAPRTELYDSGATQHISPHKADFTSYTPLSPPVYLNAANQQKFPAIGTGTLVVRVPNRGTESKLTLHNVLHAPAVSYTLVSLRTLAKQGYSCLLEGDHLRITSPHGEQVAEVFCNACNLYQVVHSPESAHAVELLSAMELHRRLSHISVANARKLVQSGAVKGIDLDPNALDEVDCDACIFARATRLPISKPPNSTPAKNFGDVIHSDVWGPINPPTPKG